MVVASKTWGPRAWPHYVSRGTTRSISPRANKRIRKKYTASPKEVRKYERALRAHAEWYRRACFRILYIGLR